MQAIERYGVVALLLLIGTVVAVLVWDGTPVEAVDPATTVAAAERTATPPPAALPREEPSQPGRVSLSGRAERRGLSRADLQPAAQDPGFGLVPDTRQPEEAIWNPPPQAYQPGTWEEQPTADRRGGYPERQPTSYEEEPIRTTTYDPEPARMLREEPRTLPTTGAREGRYTIRGGDTLGQIALDQLGTSKRWREILALNPGLNEKRLFVGQEILLPTTGAAAQARPRPATASTSVASGPTYTVQRGDNLWKIAARTLGDRERWHEIRDLNPAIDPDRILVGQKLALPASARVAAEPIVASRTNTGTQPRRRVR